MATEDNKQEVAADTETSVAESQETTEPVIKLSKEDYDKLQRDLGSLKRELKDLKKPKEDTQLQDKKESSVSDFSLIEKSFFNSVGIKDADVQKLAKDMAKRTGDTLDVIVEDEVFKARAEKLLTTKQNDMAASGDKNRGTQGGSGKDTPEYWLAKLGPNDSVPSDLPRALRQQIVAKRRDASKNSKQFYND